MTKGEVVQQETMRNRALIYVGRRMRTLEDGINVDHVALAKQGMSYGDRRKLADKSDDLLNEYESWEWIDKMLRGITFLDTDKDDIDGTH